MNRAIPKDRRLSHPIAPVYAAVLLWTTACLAAVAQDHRGSAPTNPVAAQPPSVDPSNDADQEKPVAPAASPSEEDVQPSSAIVIEVEGSVDWAAAGVSPLVADGWTPVKVDDRLVPGTQVRTGLRSYVNLQFGDTTTVSVRSVTYASIDQFYRSAKAEDVRIGLGYGTVRGGSSEGEVRSGVIVDSPVATLAKRGTEGWEIEVEPGTGRFRISLAQFGLVEATQKLSADRSRSRTVRPGEYATDRNIANLWINQDIFDRNVKFYATDAVTAADAEFTADNTRGYGVMAPGGGTALVDMSGRVSADFVLDQLAANAPPDFPPPTTGVLPAGPVVRPEGNFGTGDTFVTLGPNNRETGSERRFFTRSDGITIRPRRIRGR